MEVREMRESKEILEEIERLTKVCQEHKYGSDEYTRANIRRWALMWVVKMEV